jgi:hypothetical protein
LDNLWKGGVFHVEREKRFPCEGKKKKKQKTFYRKKKVVFFLVLQSLGKNI